MYMHPLLLINLATNTESFSIRLFTYVMWRVKSTLKILRKYLDIAKIFSRRKKINYVGTDTM
jgi:hypothetical protein